MKEQNKAVFLDRDGVINEVKTDRVDHVNRPQDFYLLEKVPEAIAKLRGLGYKIFVVTNQGGVGLGYIQEKTLKKIHEKMQEDLIAGHPEAIIDDILYCPHKPFGRLLLPQAPSRHDSGAGKETSSGFVPVMDGGGPASRSGSGQKSGMPVHPGFERIYSVGFCLFIGSKGGVIFLLFSFQAKKSLNIARRNHAKKEDYKYNKPGMGVQDWLHWQSDI